MRFFFNKKKNRLSYLSTRTIVYIKDLSSCFCYLIKILFFVVDFYKRFKSNYLNFVEIEDNISQ